jgi:hypothetical protein
VSRCPTVYSGSGSEPTQNTIAGSALFLCARPISARPELGLEVLEKILKNNFIVPPEVRLQPATAAVDHFTRRLEAHFLNDGQRGRGLPSDLRGCTETLR